MLLNRFSCPLFGRLLNQIILTLEDFLHSNLRSICGDLANLFVIVPFGFGFFASLLHRRDGSLTHDLLEGTHCACTCPFFGSLE